MKIVKDIEINKILTTDGLVAELYESGGFSAKKLAIGTDILERMFKDKKCFRILSLPAAPISTGFRGLIKDLIKRKVFQAIITTSGFLDHDFARVWKPYWHGDFQMDDIELHKKEIFRLGNILIPKQSYGIILEEKVQPVLENIVANGKQSIAPYELVWELGKSLEKVKNKEQSITYWAWKNKIPVFIPGITDGAVGSQIWLFSNKKNFKIDVLADEQKLAELVFDAKKLGALMIGGGISKHHTIWWAQFKQGLDYAVYITTAVEYDGSLSGARTREAISWGKLKERARHITIEGDATIVLPVMLAALAKRLNGRIKMSEM